MLREIVYLNRDNTIDIILKADGTAADLSSVTKMEIIVDDSTTISSVTSPDAFDWFEGSGKLILALGDEGIDAGSYDAQLIVYDVDNPDGIMWSYINIVVRESG